MSLCLTRGMDSVQWGTSCLSNSVPVKVWFGPIPLQAEQRQSSRTKRKTTGGKNFFYKVKFTVTLCRAVDTRRGTELITRGLSETRQRGQKNKSYWTLCIRGQGSWRGRVVVAAAAGGVSVWEGSEYNWITVTTWQHYRWGHVLN